VPTCRLTGDLPSWRTFTEGAMVHHRIVRGAVCLLIVLAFKAAPGQTTSTQTLEIRQQIDVVANDYAFNPLPAHIAAGPTVFTFANHGTVQHEASIARLRDGVTVDSLLKVVKAGGRARDVLERSIGILIAGPGKSPDGRLWVDLLPGSSYVLICTLRDKPEAQPHAMLGMYTGFKAQ
jgi:plastocyanin